MSQTAWIITLSIILFAMLLFGPMVIYSKGTQDAYKRMGVEEQYMDSAYIYSKAGRSCLWHEGKVITCWNKEKEEFIF